MTTLVLEFMQPTRLWALALIPVIAGIYWYLANRISQSQTPNSRLRFVIPKDAAWKRHGAVLLALLSLASLVIAWAMPKAGAGPGNHRRHDRRLLVHGGR